MTVSSDIAGNVFLAHVAPAAGIDLAEVERRLVAHAGVFSLAARPAMPPDVLSHRVLRGAGGVFVWEIVFDGVDVPDEEAPHAESFSEAIHAEMASRVAPFASLASFEVYQDALVPPPGPGYEHISIDDGEIVPFDEGAEDLPVWQDHARDSGKPEAGKELSEDLAEYVRKNRAAMPVEPGMVLEPRKRGYIYVGRNDAAHLAYLKGYFERFSAKASAGDRRKVLSFRALLGREGSTTAINTYDNQIVTWGTGWGGLGGMGRVVERALTSRAVRELFASTGVHYRGKNTYDVVDLEAHLVVTGKQDALEAMRRSKELLYMLIQAARAPETRDAVTEAQLVSFMSGSANISSPDGVATQALFNYVVHLHHWLPGCAIGCLDWALPQVESGSPTPERDRRLATLVTRYFYGKAPRYKITPSWKQIQQYWGHMKEDGLDCMSDPFIQASGPPTDDPFVAVPIPTTPAAQPAKPAATVLKNAPLAGVAELEAIANGKGALRRGARGAGAKAVQQALVALGIPVEGGADGLFGAGSEAAVKVFQASKNLSVDGVVGPGTLKALDKAAGGVVAK
jgi:hypothetical protein